MINHRNIPFEQPSWNHAFVTFNNQDSILMKMTFQNLLCLFHDNRIFAFTPEATAPDNVASDTSTPEQKVILNILTTPKYRAMSFMYLIFRFLDNAFLLLLILLSIRSHQIQIPTPEHYALYGVFGIEIFYDIMLYTHHYWLLRRLSIYIGLGLYAAYLVIVSLKYERGQIAVEQIHLVFLILIIRFAAYFFEQCVNVAIGGELHNDLLRVQHCSGESEMTRIQRFWNYINVCRHVTMPNEVKYVGSFFAWTSLSVSDRDVWRVEPFPRWAIYLLCAIPFIVALALLVAVTFVVTIVAVISFSLTNLFVYRTLNPIVLWPKFVDYVKELIHF